MACMIDQNTECSAQLIVKNTFIEYIVKLHEPMRSRSEPPALSSSRDQYGSSTISRPARRSPRRTFRDNHEGCGSDKASLKDSGSTKRRTCGGSTCLQADVAFGNGEPCLDTRSEQFSSLSTHVVSSDEGSETSSSEDSPSMSSAVTTLMICDLPCCVGYDRLKFELRALGFDGSYDYLHLPKKSRSKNFIGYGFINFFAAADALRLTSVFTGHQFAGINSTKKGRIEVARLQGSLANIEQHGLQSCEYDGSGLRA
eukprot:TRINITY_DN78449_c0_g1_i1.p1 TRINITY_DN78449_c0_g1~~TRINITY_DN78449_c0_g1_i1.p1  ORF type:complete len:275 (+),score=43.35 TRINITY_DN78449_c0_g1_i1:59-826(+)